MLDKYPVRSVLRGVLRARPCLNIFDFELYQNGYRRLLDGITSAARAQQGFHPASPLDRSHGGMKQHEHRGKYGSL